MTPQPKKRSLASEIVFIGALLVLLLILGACAVYIYDYVTPAASPTPTTDPTATVTPRPTMPPTVTATATAKPSATVDPGGYYQEDTKVTMGEFEYYYPAVWERYIVYDMFDGVKNYTKLYDTVSKETTQVDDGIVFSFGTISNGKIMLFYPNSGNKIYLYDIKTRESYLTCTDDNNARGSITMYGSKLAYYQDLGHNNIDGVWVPDYHIYVFNMIEGYAADVMDKIPKPLDIRIYEDRLVYTVVSDTGSDIYLLDLSWKTPVPQKISKGSGNNNHARIYDHYIVYHSDAEGSDHIYVYDINTQATISPTSEGQQWNADIYGSTVVYDDNVDGNWNIYAFDLNTHNKRQLTNEPHDQRVPVIYGNRIAYMDNRDGYSAIYTMVIA